MRSVRGECSSGTRRQYLRLSGRVPLCKSAGEHWAPICRAYYASTHLPTGQTPGISCPAIAHNPNDQHLEHIMPLQNVVPLPGYSYPLVREAIVQKIPEFYEIFSQTGGSTGFHISYSEIIKLVKPSIFQRPTYLRIVFLIF